MLEPRGSRGDAMKSITELARDSDLVQGICLEVRELDEARGIR